MSEERRGRSGGSAGSRQSLRVRGIASEAVRQLDPLLQAIEVSKAEMVKGKGNKRKKVPSESIQEGDEDLDRGDVDQDK